jgi:hypothetical protein
LIARDDHVCSRAILHSEDSSNHFDVKPGRGGDVVITKADAGEPSNRFAFLASGHLLEAGHMGDVPKQTGKRGADRHMFAFARRRD